MLHSHALALIPALLCGVTTATAEVYRWVDEQGRTHMADVVPDRYKADAHKITPKGTELSKREQAEAAQRAADWRAGAAQPQAPVAPAGAAHLPAPARTSPVRPGESECDRQWRAYHDSQACFAPFQTRVGIRGEAFAHCKEEKNPSQKCGPAKYPGW